MGLFSTCTFSLSVCDSSMLSLLKNMMYSKKLRWTRLSHRNLTCLFSLNTTRTVYTYATLRNSYHSHILHSMWNIRSVTLCSLLCYQWKRHPMDNSEVNSLLTASFSYDEMEIDHAWAIYLAPRCSNVNWLALSTGVPNTYLLDSYFEFHYLADNSWPDQLPFSDSLISVQVIFLLW